MKRMRCAVFSFLFFGWQTKVNIIALETWSEEQDLTVRTVKYTTVPIQASGGRRLYVGEGGKGVREGGGRGDCEKKCEVRNAASVYVCVFPAFCVLLLPAAAAAATTASLQLLAYACLLAVHEFRPTRYEENT
ncbi:hypothetical protein BJ912DRAFT_952793 [Pholiota molesta]|nr:hypothetical protein BJ912DRAFT_952793 [Pholiota molesta]